MQQVHDIYNYRRFLKIETHFTPQQPTTQTPGRTPEPPNIDRLIKQNDTGTLPNTLRTERAIRLQQIDERYYTVPDTPEPTRLALMWNNLGLKQLENGDLPRAFRNLQQAIQYNPALPMPHNNLGILYLELGDLQQARHHLDIAIDLQPSMDTPYGNLGLAWMEAGHYELARWYLQQAHHLAPNDPFHHNNLGIFYLETGNLENALYHLTMAVELDDSNPIHYSNRGMIYDAIGEPALANLDYGYAVQLAEAQFQAELDLQNT